MGMLRGEMNERSRVTLPPGAGASFEVYVNAVRQVEGVDYVLEGRELVFPRALRKEGTLSKWRWLSLFLGVAGTYRQNDSVDVVYSAGGRRVVAAGLPISPGDPADQAA
jgi:hypothetical protein